ncbi:serine/threonine protein kinase, partial [Pantanalinema rosaneae CENA516]|uniref:serine/threonine protein kinase n=1 Tax=Pantanalinema rosaneae TaxID=1620701 RepID=UPI003D6F5F9C
MFILPGYQIRAQLHESSRSLIYRGERQSDHIPVILKVLKPDYPSLSDLIRLRNHYTIATYLDLPGIVRPLALERDRNGLALVMPDEELISLSNYYANLIECNSTQILPTILTIAIQLADILEGLYCQRVIHKDIQPSNILIHPRTGQVKLTDFGVASQLLQETQELQPPEGLEGTLAYLSPEQTGRMNRGIDYRSDFYSLGITLFELFTGQLPFQSTDPMELIHCHIAQPIPSMAAFKPEIPNRVSAIVSKLMAKNAEDRYQSALGLKHDLELCLSQWQETGTITEFKLGQRDVSDRLLIPEKLYGREQEVATLLAAFERVVGGGAVSYTHL